MRLSDPYVLANFARTRRRELNLTQADLAKKVGVSREWVVRLEKGSPRLEVGKVFDVLDALHAVPEVQTTKPQAARAEPDPFARVFGNL